MRQRKHNRGFTIIELLITVAVAAVLVAVAAPNLSTVLQNNRAATQANTLVTALNMARSEAVSKGVRVVLCPSTDGSTCTGGNNWADGWIIFRDADGDGAPAGPDDLVRVWGTLAGNPVLNGPLSLQYRSQGEVNAAGVFNLELPNCQGDQERTISVNIVGRPSVQRRTCS